MASGKNGPASLQLVGATDEICSACPHNKGGSCESAEKVERYDAGVLKYTGLKAGQEMTFAEFERIVEEKILQPGYAGSSAATASGEISATNNEEHSHAGVLFCIT